MRRWIAPRQYALSQSHKHLPEMAKVCGLAVPPVFTPIVADFYSGHGGDGRAVSTSSVQRHEGRCGRGAARALRNRRAWCVIPPRRTIWPPTRLRAGTAWRFAWRAMRSACCSSPGSTILGKGASGAAVQCIEHRLGLGRGHGLAAIGGINMQYIAGRRMRAQGLQGGGRALRHPPESFQARSGADCFG